MNHAEAVAKSVLEAALPGAILRYREEQSHGEYDFDLHYANGDRAAAEVTAAVDETLARTAGAILNKRKGGSVITAEFCKKSWVVFPAYGASINNIRANADRSLAKLEFEEIDRFSWVRGDSPSVREVCSGLGVTSGAVVYSEGKPIIRISFPLGGGAVGASIAISAGESEAWKPDNRKKLGAAKTAERHLVVYVDANNGLPWSALTCFTPPSTSPKIPDEITNIWLIGHTGEKNEFVLWSASTVEAWRSMTVVC